MKLKRLFIAVSLFFAIAPMALAQHTYYISTSGSDNNTSTQAQSQSTPWAHVPGQSGAVNNAAAYVPVAGDKFVLKGGDIWTGSGAALVISHNGSSGNPIYYGVCLSSDSDSPCSGGTSWPSSGWVKPVLDLQFASPAYAISGVSRTNVTIDNLEIRGQQVNPSTSFTTNGCGIMFQPTRGFGNWMTGTTVENIYMHGGQVGSSTNNWAAGSANSGWCILGIQGAQTVKNSEISTEDVGTWIAGTKQTGCTGANSDGCLGGGVAIAQVVSGNKIHGGSQGTTNVFDQHGNEYYHIWQNKPANLVGLHTQVIEDAEACSGSQGVLGSQELVYNNLLHDNNAGVNIFVRYFSDIYNNVGWNTASVTQGNLSGNNPMRLCIPNGDSAGKIGHVFNNTWDTTSKAEALMSATCFSSCTALGTFNNQNNVNIGTGGIGGLSAGGGTTGNNYAMGASEATTFGFTVANLLAPTNSFTPDSNIVGAGINLTSVATGNLSALTSDASGTSWFGASFQTRPSSSAWTIGAYVLPASGVPGLPLPVFSPGGGNYTTSQSVTISGSGSGVTYCYTTDGTTPTATTPGTCSHGTTFSTAITVSTPETLNAIATKSGSVNSSMATAQYFFGPIFLTQTTQSDTCSAGSSCTIQIAATGAGSSYAGICFASNLNGSTQNHLTSCTDTGGTADTFQSCTAVGGASCNNQGSGVGNTDAQLYLSGGGGNTSLTCNLASANTHAWTCGFQEFQTTLSGWSFDASGSAGNITSSTTQSGVALTLSGTNDAIFQGLVSNSGACASISPSGSGGSGGYSLNIDGFGDCQALLWNSNSGSAPTFTLSSAGNAGTIAVALQSPATTSTVATPTFSPSPGSYTSAQTVTLSDATVGATICYTTDGTTPTATTPGTCSHGTTYSGTISVNSTETIKALGTKAAFTNSAVASGTYTINSSVPAVSFTQANLSVVWVYTPVPSAFIGFSSAVPVTMKNVGSATLTWSAISITNPAGATFYNLSPVGGTTCGATGSLAPGSSCILIIDATVTAVGNFSGTLTVTDNTPSGFDTLGLSVQGVNGN